MTQSAAKLHWNPWPVSIIGFFAIALLCCGVFITFCNRNPAELVAADYYEQELHFQGQMERMRNAQEIDGPSAVVYNAATRQLKISLPAGQAGGQTSGRIQLYRPSASSLDRQVKFAPDAAGQQWLDAAHLQPGLWKVRIAWTRNEQDFYIDQQVVIGPAQNPS